MVGWGSSPLTRGKPPPLRPGRAERGLIPAHAGKTRARRRGQTRWEAHPRSRGENNLMNVAVSSISGSSPLTRGKLLPCLHLQYTPGLIPAHAGKTAGGLCPRVGHWAHPRSRGENRARWWGVRIGQGSSPLTRGKPVTHGGDGAPERLIPAHAGKTHRANTITSARRAHPRSRGENRVKEHS